MDSLEIVSSDATLGAIVSGVRLGEIDETAFAAIEAAWDTHAVLVFPDQHLTSAEHIAFSRRFGPLERSVSRRIEEEPEIIVLSNVRANGELAPPGSKRDLSLAGNRSWHTDSSFKAVPSKASLLTARQVPTHGGETEFADMRAAFDRLDDATKSWLEERTAVHDFVYSQSLVDGLGGMTEHEIAALPPVEHPLVRIHPRTGRKSLYAGRHASHVKGEDVARSRALLQALCGEACRAPRVFTHHWQPGDLVIWDNRCVLHRGRTYPHDQPRVMARTTVAGEAAENPWALAPTGTQG